MKKQSQRPKPGSKRRQRARAPKRAHTFTVLIERDEDGWLVASVPALRGCFTQARTLAELEENLREAISAYLEAIPGAAESVRGNEFVAVQRVAV